MNMLVIQLVAYMALHNNLARAGTAAVTSSRYTASCRCTRCFLHPAGSQGMTRSQLLSTGRSMPTSHGQGSSNAKALHSKSMAHSSLSTSGHPCCHLALGCLFPCTWRRRSQQHYQHQLPQSQQSKMLQHSPITVKTRHRRCLGHLPGCCLATQQYWQSRQCCQPSTTARGLRCCSWQT